MRTAVILGFAIALCAGASALAQDTDARTPGRGPKGSLFWNKGSDGQRVLNRFADCLVAGNRPRVEAYLATVPGSRKAQELVNGMKGGLCNNSIHLFADDRLIRGALYEALFLVDFRDSAVVGISEASPIEYTVEARRGNKEEAALHKGLLALADCVTRQDPAGVRELLLAEVGTAREAKAFGALKPSFGPCLYSDQSIEFSRASLRSFLAETLYRLAASQAALRTGTN